MSDQPSTSTSGTRRFRDRGQILGLGGMWLAKWALCLVLIAAGGWVVWNILGYLWVGVLPVLLAIVVSTVLWPPTRAMAARGVPQAAAAGITIAAFLAVLAGIVALIVPSVVDQSPELANKASQGITQVQDWIKGPPINLQDDQIDSAVQAVIHKLQASAQAIASGVFSGVSAAGSALVTLVLVLVLSFFFIKDGPRFLPWLHGVTGGRAGRHFEAVSIRIWDTLGGFIRTQALVSFVDAFFIGLGLVVLGVPLAPVLAVLTFIGGFIPIVGAFVAGALAVLVALVAKGWTTALIILIIVIAVQQLEGNVLQPVLQSRTMKLHAVIVLLAVTVGGSLFGIIGAFLAVPVAAVAAVVIRYIGEQVDLKLEEGAGTEPGPAVTNENDDEPGSAGLATAEAEAGSA
ncbi:AI-2E family transporter [Rhodococcus maanshanensis]|uniref:Predicted PurR-regulated permease PerM n=1 Tax=Rhodococcus maanshanensis TaxID=183556 RepID=A0A1H7MWC1_9NOCA|nr:AI-2E family transporter [Rhodococcus maanshanensis]SEL15088.1 Predicted PurR-regulated permease PerM [Rhodococcus maanshanensis]